MTYTLQQKIITSVKRGVHPVEIALGKGCSITTVFKAIFIEVGLNPALVPDISLIKYRGLFATHLSSNFRKP